MFVSMQLGGAIVLVDDTRRFHTEIRQFGRSLDSHDRGLTQESSVTVGALARVALARRTRASPGGSSPQ